MVTRRATPGRHTRSDGAVTTEYALMAALIALVVVGAVTALGLATLGLFEPVLNGF